MNVHGLKLSHKRMVERLRFLYTDKENLENRLSYVNNKISQLEKAKHQCMKQIKDKKK